ncbi:MAG: serine/threonine-protein kinase, partial [Chloroflexota bacterium]
MSQETIITSPPVPEKPRFTWHDALSLALAVVIIGAFWGVYALLALLMPTAVAAPIAISGAAAGFAPLHQRANLHLAAFIESRQPATEAEPAEEKESIASRLIWQRGGLTGKEIGGFTLTNMIGKGGMSEIYTAESGGLLLAIKVVDVKTSPELLMRFQREITTLERAKHPNIVQVFDSGVDDDYAYMVMEYIDGIDLKSHIVEHAPLPIEEVVVILRDIAAAVDYIHSLDIIHRDLKPGNIMLFWDSRKQVHATLLDFGVATTKALTVITLEGTVGTIEYMSPEQILDAPLVQPTSDVYAVGVMAYNMLTGELP